VGVHEREPYWRLTTVPYLLPFNGSARLLAQRLSARTTQRLQALALGIATLDYLCGDEQENIRVVVTTPPVELVARLKMQRTRQLHRQLDLPLATEGMRAMEGGHALGYCFVYFV
jgi:hypothetical protein